MNTVLRSPALLPSGPMLLLALSFSAGMVCGDTGWPHWRGPNANGSVTSGNSPVKWNASKGEVVCLESASGKTIWTGSFPEHRAPYYSSPVVANGILYAAREDGTVFSARVEEKFELLGENPMGERVIASPVPASNRLFIRGDKHLFCVGK